MNIGLIGKGKMATLLKEESEKKGNTVLCMADAFDKAPLQNCAKDLDVLIDFSHPDNLEWVLDAIQGQKCALIIGTTGYSEKQKERIAKEAENRPVFFAANYSLGIALLQKLAASAARTLADWDVEIIEKHHNQKVDAPSGTALALADAIDSEKQKERIYGRSGHTGSRGNEIGIHAVRGGSVAGDHDVLFLGPQEIVTLSHHAQSREIFVHGALKAADFIVKMPKGFYSMQDLIDLG
jgi:4-hydroxy-tetrahydrodipicolinate reductase